MNNNNNVIRFFFHRSIRLFVFLIDWGLSFIIRGRLRLRVSNAETLCWNRNLYPQNTWKFHFRSKYIDKNVIVFSFFFLATKIPEATMELKRNSYSIILFTHTCTLKGFQNKFPLFKGNFENKVREIYWQKKKKSQK